MGIDSHEFENYRLLEVASAIKNEQMPHDEVRETLIESAFLDACSDSILKNGDTTREVMRDSIRTDDDTELMNILGEAIAADLPHYQQMMHSDGLLAILELGENLTINNVINLQKHCYTADVADTVTKALIDIAVSEYLINHIDEIDELLPLAEQEWAELGQDREDFSDDDEDEEEDPNYIDFHIVCEFFKDIYFKDDGTLLALRMSLMKLG